MNIFSKYILKQCSKNIIVQWILSLEHTEKGKNRRNSLNILHLMIFYREMQSVF